MKRWKFDLEFTGDTPEGVIDDIHHTLWNHSVDDLIKAGALTVVDDGEDDDPICDCGVHESEHALCGCEMFYVS